MAADRDDLGLQIGAIARLTGQFTLRSGQVSDRYFDKYRFEADPALLRRLAAEMAALIPPRTEVLAGLELGGVPIATALSLHTGLPAAFVRKEAKTYGTCQAVEGQGVAGKRVAIIEDVITTGGAVVASARHLQEAGAEIVAVICAIWRSEEEPGLAGLDAPVLPAFTMSQLG